MEEAAQTEQSESFNRIKKMAAVDNVEYREVQPLKEKLKETEIIERVGGGDMTNGSCSSLAFAYVGNKGGLDVLDFRGGSSQYLFSSNLTIAEIAQLNGVKGIVSKEYDAIKDATRLLNEMENDKEYYLAVGAHAAIVKRDSDGLKYLELQSAIKNGFELFGKNTLRNRFGAKKSSTIRGTKLKQTTVLIDTDTLCESAEFRELLGYINTAETTQKKGVKGFAK